MEAERKQIYDENLSLEQIMKLKFSLPCTSSQEEYLVLMQFNECDQKVGIQSRYAINDNMTIRQLKQKWYAVNIGKESEKYPFDEILMMYETDLFLQSKFTIKQLKEMLKIERFPSEAIIRIYRQQCPHCEDECAINYENYEMEHYRKIETFFHIYTQNGQSQGYFSLQSHLLITIKEFKNVLQKKIKEQCQNQDIPSYRLKIKKDSLSEQKLKQVLQNIPVGAKADVEKGSLIDITQLNALKIRQVIPPVQIVIIQFNGQTPNGLIQQYTLDIDPIVKILTFQNMNQNKTIQKRVITRRYSQIRNINVSALLHEERVPQAPFTSVYFKNQIFKPRQKFQELEDFIQDQEPQEMQLVCVPENILYYFQLKNLEKKKIEQIVETMFKKTTTDPEFPKLLSIRRQKLRNKNPNRKEFTEEDFLDPIILYTGPYFYYPLNKFLRQSTVSLVSSRNLQKLDDYWHYSFSEKLIKSLLKIKNEKGTFYRGSVSMNYNYEVGQIIQWNCFTSTSKQQPVAKNFIISQMKQKYKNGLPASTAQMTYLFEIEAYSGKNIEGYSYYEKEKEVLILPYTKFKVTKKQIVDLDPSTPQIKVTLVKLVEIPIPKRVAGNIVVWIDANVDEILSTFTDIVERNQLKDFDLVQLVSNEHFELWLNEFKHVLLLPEVKVHFISNMNRPPLFKQEGIRTLEIVRSFDPTGQFVFYIGNVKRCNDLLTSYCQQTGKEMNQLKVSVFNHPKDLSTQFMKWSQS